MTFRGLYFGSDKPADPGAEGVYVDVDAVQEIILGSHRLNEDRAIGGVGDIDKSTYCGD